MRSGRVRLEVFDASRCRRGYRRGEYDCNYNERHREGRSQLLSECAHWTTGMRRKQLIDTIFGTRAFQRKSSSTERGRTGFTDRASERERVLGTRDRPLIRISFKMKTELLHRMIGARNQSRNRSANVSKNQPPTVSTGDMTAFVRDPGIQLIVVKMHERARRQNDLWPEKSRRCDHHLTSSDDHTSVRASAKRSVRKRASNQSMRSCDLGDAGQAPRREQYERQNHRGLHKSSTAHSHMRSNHRKRGVPTPIPQSIEWRCSRQQRKDRDCCNGCKQRPYDQRRQPNRRRDTRKHIVESQRVWDQHRDRKCGDGRHRVRFSRRFAISSARCRRAFSESSLSSPINLARTADRASTEAVASACSTLREMYSASLNAGL